MSRPAFQPSSRIWVTLLLIFAGLVPAADAQQPPAQPTMSRILFGSCAKQNRPIPIFSTIVSHKPDLFIFMGDNIYADTSDLDVMRQKYAALAERAEFRTLRDSCPILATWDDHDYGINDGGADFNQKQGAERLFLDFWRIPADSPRRQRPGVYGAHTFGPIGRRIQVLLLDTRYFRGPLEKGPKRVGGSYVPTTNTRIPLLGEPQWKWLEQRLREPANLRILVSSIQCLPADAGQECWANLPHERRRLFQLIEDTRASGLLIISGDRHWAELSTVSQNVPYPLWELTASSFNQVHPRGTPTTNRYRADRRTFHRENFGALMIDWNQPDPRLKFQILDIQGQIQIEKQLRLSTLTR